MRVSNTRTRRKTPATPSTAVGMRPAPSTASSPPSPISEKRAAASTVARAASGAGSATSSIARNRARSWIASWSWAPRNGCERGGEISGASAARPVRSRRGRGIDLGGEGVLEASCLGRIPVRSPRTGRGEGGFCNYNFPPKPNRQSWLCWRTFSLGKSEVILKFL